MQNYIIIANGECLVKEIISEAISDKVIVALDGAIHKLACMGIKPDVILGDFDSIIDDSNKLYGVEKTFAELNDHAQPYLGKHGIMIVPAKDQNLTDLAKAIHYCDQQQAASITIICAHGGRTDHEESAKRLLRTAYKANRPITLHTDQQSLRYAQNETIEINGHIGDKCGIMAFPHGKLTSHGLEYDVDNYVLDFGFSESVSNSLKQTPATIRIEGEALIIMPPQLTSQRWFMQKSATERLELLLRDLRHLQSK